MGSSAQAAGPLQVLKAYTLYPAGAGLLPGPGPCGRRAAHAPAPGGESAHSPAAGALDPDAHPQEL